LTPSRTVRIKIGRGDFRLRNLRSNSSPSISDNPKSSKPKSKSCASDHYFARASVVAEIIE
jgi:hypothetical protein